MIVNYKESGWEVITQRAHGLLAAQLAYHWKAKVPTQRWLETLLAIAGHDDAEFEFNSDKLLTSAGGPINYTMKHFDARHCHQQALSSQARSRYISLLNSMHLVFIYQKEAESNHLAAKFIAEQEKLQEKLRKTLKIRKAESARIYALMQWCDAFSLIICQHAIQPEHRMSEISKGPDKVSYEVAEAGKNILTIHPWPFSPKRITVFVESRDLPMLEFENAGQFRDALYTVKVKENRYDLIRK